MNIEQRRWTEAQGWEIVSSNTLQKSAHLVFVFGATAVLKQSSLIEKVKELYPEAYLIGCSTAGEICCTRVLDNSLVVTAMHFENTRLKGAQVNIDSMENSFQAGKMLAQTFDPNGLAHVFVLSNGLNVNGSELVKGLTQHLPDHIAVTGGLAGDGARFEETLAFWNSSPAPDSMAALGFYGDRLKVGYGSLGGWDPFGPERLVTRSEGNILYELDGQSALKLYKMYLAEHAQGLPATGLLFPLKLRTHTDETGVVRTILSVNEEEQSMTFAGDIPEGAYVRLMKANFDRLVDGAVGAANTSYQAIDSTPPDLAILISCVGRKLILKQRIEEEVEGVREVLGDDTTLTGFYSYGEIAPFMPGAGCELHNQTMTITTFLEE